jgi:integrase
MLTDSPPRKANRAGFLESERIKTLNLPQDGRLLGIAKSLESAIDTPNPMRDVSIPNCRAHGRETAAYSLEEELKMLSVLAEPARTIVGTAAFSGLRWGSYAASNGRITWVPRFEWRSRFTTALPPRPSPEASRASVPVIAPLKKLLAEHRARSGNPQTASIFAARNGRSMSMNNVLNREILPTLKAAGIPWKGWHAFRRGLATNLHALGVDDLTIQRILRHSNVAVTQKCYIKTLPEQSVAGMRRLEVALNEVSRVQ